MSDPFSPYSAKDLNDRLVGDTQKIPEEIALELAELAKEYPYFNIGYHEGDDVWYAMLEDHLIWVHKKWIRITKNKSNRYTTLLNNWRGSHA